jgi:hypothetical protein
VVLANNCHESEVAYLKRFPIELDSVELELILRRVYA